MALGSSISPLQVDQMISIRQEHWPILPEGIPRKIDSGNSLGCPSTFRHAPQRIGDGAKYNHSPRRPGAAHAERPGRANVADRAARNIRFFQLARSEETNVTTVRRPERIGGIFAACNR